MCEFLDYFNGKSALKTVYIYIYIYIYIYVCGLFISIETRREVKILGWDWNFLKIFLDVIYFVPLLNYWNEKCPTDMMFRYEKNTIDRWCWE